MDKRNYMGAIWAQKVERHGDWGRKCKNVKIVFPRISSSKLDRFTPIQDKKDHRPIQYMSSNTFQQRKCLFLWYLSVCLSHTSHTFRSFNTGMW